MLAHVQLGFLMRCAAGSLPTPHSKECIEADKMFDFLQSTVSEAPTEGQRFLGNGGGSGGAGVSGGGGSSSRGGGSTQKRKRTVEAMPAVSDDVSAGPALVSAGPVFGTVASTTATCGEGNAVHAPAAPLSKDAEIAAVAHRHLEEEDDDYD